MVQQLRLDILPQPDLLTCGPTCLHAVYRYFGEEIALADVIGQIPQLRDGGTLAVLLGCHALRRGWQAQIYTFNLDVFDPTWFAEQPNRFVQRFTEQRRDHLIERLQAQRAVKTDKKLRHASKAYIEFLELGGSILMRDLTVNLLRHYLKRSIPVLTGLSSTYLYRDPREFGPECQPADLRAMPTRHFVFLCGYNSDERTIRVADPSQPNPLGEKHHYEVGLEHLVCSIMLGSLTYDANLLIVEPPERDSIP